MEINNTSRIVSSSKLPQKGKSLSGQANKTLEEVLGNQYNSEDSKGFASALNSAFKTDTINTNFQADIPKDIQRNSKRVPDESQQAQNEEKAQVEENIESDSSTTEAKKDEESTPPRERTELIA